MASLEIKPSRKDVVLNATLKNLKDGVYLCEFDGDYIVMKKGDNFFGFCNNEDGSCPSNIVELDYDAWKNEKMKYSISKLLISYEITGVR